MAFKQRAYNSVFLLRKSIFLMSFPVSCQFFVLDLINLISGKKKLNSSFCCVIRASSPVRENTLSSPAPSTHPVFNMANQVEKLLTSTVSVSRDCQLMIRSSQSPFEPCKDEARWVSMADKGRNCYLTFASAPLIEDGSTSWAQAWSKPHKRMSDNLLRLNQPFVVLIWSNTG